MGTGCSESKKKAEERMMSEVTQERTRCYEWMMNLLYNYVADASCCQDEQRRHVMFCDARLIHKYALHIAGDEHAPKPPERMDTAELMNLIYPDNLQEPYRQMRKATEGQ